MTKAITYQQAYEHYLKAVRLMGLSHTKKTRRIAEIQQTVSDCNNALHELYDAGLVVSIEGFEKKGSDFKDYTLQKLQDWTNNPDFKDSYFPTFKKDVWKKDLPPYTNSTVQLKPDCFWTGFSYARPVNEGVQDLSVLEKRTTTEQKPDCGCGCVDGWIDWL